MPLRGPYKLYYDKKYTKKIPRSTMSTWRRKLKRKIKSKPQQQSSFTVTDNIANTSLNVQSNNENEIEAARMLDVWSNINFAEAMHIPLNNEATDPSLQTNKSTTTNENKSSYRCQSKEKLMKKFCNCTDVNVAEVLLLFMNIFKKHSLTWMVLLDIFEVLNYILKREVFPVTKYSVKNLLGVTTESLSNHIVCHKCNKYLKKTNESNFTITCPCGSVIKSSSVGSFFIEINPVPQLQSLLEDSIVISALEKRFHRNKVNENALEDIYDGKIYKEYSKNPELLGNPYNFSYTFNTDGCKSADSSKVTIWPIYMMLHEFPNYLRRNCMVLRGLWVAKKEPDMSVFLQSFVDNANELSTKGYKWNYKGKDVVSYLFPLGCCVDSPARAAMLNMKRFNGFYGCIYCEHPTESVDGLRKYPMLNEPPQLRTNDSIKQHMIAAAHENGKSDIIGVLGPSPLMYLKHFDLVKGMVLDFMHSCLLGVTESHMTILMTNTTEDYYIGSPANTYLINEKLLAIKPPSCIARILRDIEERNKWKASQWLSWLIYYSLICLKGILPVKYYNHWALFVTAMNIFLHDTITPQSLQTAAILIVKYVHYFEQLYGKKYMYYNIHLLLHLKDTVQNWGPLWANSTFDFENENRLLLKKKKCNNRIAQQIVYRLIVYQQLPLLQQRNYISNDTRNFCNNINNNNRLKNYEKIENCYLLGRGKIHELSELQKMYLRNFFNVSKISTCLMYTKIIFDGCRYTSCTYKQSTKTNDSLFRTKHGDFGIIQKICKITYNNNRINVFIFFNKINIQGTYIVENADVSVRYLKHCIIPQTYDLNIISYDDIHRPCILMKLKNDLFISSLNKAMIAKNVN